MAVLSQLKKLLLILILRKLNIWMMSHTCYLSYNYLMVTQKWMKRSPLFLLFNYPLGNILYYFPSVHCTPLARGDCGKEYAGRWVHRGIEVDKFLKETEWKFGIFGTILDFDKKPYNSLSFNASMVNRKQFDRKSYKMSSEARMRTYVRACLVVQNLTSNIFR